MTNQFDKILRGSFFTTKVNIFHKKNDKSDWINLVSKNKIKFEDFVKENGKSSLKIHSNDDSKSNVFIYKIGRLFIFGHNF